MAKIPDKRYFKIGEVARITGVKAYVLRYWESEFKIINPQKSSSKQRVYTKKDIEQVVEIKRLLYKEKYTLEGAKRKIGEFKKRKAEQIKFAFTDAKDKETLKTIRKELVSIRKILTDGA